MGATNTLARVAASIGELNGAAPNFIKSLDVPNGGVLFALPALLVSGLLSHAEKYFQLPSGYYRLDSIFLLLSFMALARIKAVEELRYCSPGEWGKVVGLDRCPEVKTLRAKIGLLSDNNKPSQWAGALSKEWMESEPDNAMLLYVDGHVRTYTGHQTKLPKHYVSRQKLCLRATTDYWVNAMDGRPFFLITQEIDPGLIKVLEEKIVPRLKEEVPNQPTEKQLTDDKLLHRFTLIFDREGYSPDFFKRLRKMRIACLTYNKHPKKDWSKEEFSLCEVKLASGNIVQMELAERGTKLRNGFWVREVRKQTAGGHQTSILTTDYKTDLMAASVVMFARWSQENFLKYMRIHYNIDRLVDYSTEPIPDTAKVVNPEHRNLDKEVRKKIGILNHRIAKFGKITYEGDIDSKKVEQYQQQKADLQEEIGHLKKETEKLKSERAAIQKHITIAELPQEERFNRLRQQSKYLIDTIKMIAYRAETAMANVLREKLSHTDEARILLRGIYSTEADILPDEKEKILTVRLHQLANQMSTESIQQLCSELNSTETIFPGTNLRMVFEMV